MEENKFKSMFESTLDLKDEKEDLEEQNNYKVGDNIQYNLDDVAKVNPGVMVNDDSGKIVRIEGDTYIVKSHLDYKTEIKVPRKFAIAYGSAGADGQV